MQLSIIDQATMKIEHESSPSIIVSIREFAKTKFISYDANKEIIDPFKEINMFMNTCLKRQQKQDIYNAYATIFEEFGLKSLDVDKLFVCIQQQMKIIYNIVTVDAIQEYMERENLFNIPPDIKENFTGEYAETRTYNRAKYKGLIALSVAGRLAIPAWGEFSVIRKSTIGANRLPIPLMKMLVGTSILESEQFKAFEAYSNSTVEAGSHSAELVAGGLGTEFNITINLAANFVKKVATGLNLTTNSFATNIYNFTANRGPYNDASGGDMVYAKTDIGHEEEKSKMEKYSLREQMSQGDVSMIEYYLDSPKRVMQAVVPDIPEELWKRAYDLSLYLDKIDYIPNETNIRICQWVLAYVVPPKVLLYVGFLYQRRVLASVTFILIHLGFPHLAALALSVESVSSDGVVLSYKVTRHTMPKDISDKLSEFYPLKPKSKEADNMAILAINNFYSLINNMVFKVVASEEVTKFFLEKKVLNRHLCHSVKADTPIELARMVIAINELGETKQAEV